MNQQIDVLSTRVAVTQPDAGQRRLSRLKARRKLWLKVHLYLGLSVGLILLVIGMTGSILTFWLEIDRWLNPGLMIVDVPQGAAIFRSMAEIVAAANTALPATAEFSYAYPPHQPDQAYYFFYDLPTGDADKRHSMNVFVNPYTADVIGTRVFYHASNLLDYCLIGVIFKLHYALLAGETGMLIDGILGVIFFISILTGLILWWPLTGKWWQALTIKRRASTERFNYDLHKTVGFYSALVLLAVFLSGISMNLSEQFNWLVERFSPVNVVSDYKTQPRYDQSVVTVDQAWQGVEKLYPNGYLYLFSVPNSDTGVYVFNIIGPLGGGFHGRWKVLVDRYGEVLHTFDPLSGTGGNVFMQWMWPLHSGQALGMAGRILVLLSGIVCVVLFITGVTRWLQKQRAKKAFKH
ncbi:MAG: PepSY domain-containing protein [Methyloglobulus sp.]|nr:PepSY domain-containing protein [Methyloglobulus sp.]